MKVKIKCNYCGKEAEKDHWNIRKHKPSYCNNKCSNAKTNSKWDNYIPQSERKICEKCGQRRDYRNKNNLCQKCLNIEIRLKILETPIGELRKKHKLKIGKWYSSELRIHCRNHNYELTKLPCQVCGYDKHVELCHIKPISSFTDEITIGEINDPTNILVLCPNHHWEFDNQLIILSEIGRRGGS